MKALVLGDSLYEEFFENIGFSLISDISDANLIVFTGGTDINPSMYGEDPFYMTDIPDIKRDRIDLEIFYKAEQNKIPLFGICRGAQFLCAMAGGKLYQHVYNHNIGHVMHTKDGDMNVTSSHHQMMRINNKVNADVLGWSDNRSEEYFGANGKVDPPKQDLEVVYFKDIDALAHQPHPEWMDIESPYVQWTTKQIYDLVEGKLK